MKLRLLAPALCLAASCNSAPSAGVALHDPSAVDDFYALPYPSNERLNPDGTVDLSAYKHGLNDQIDEYLVDLDDKMKGFGTQSGVFFRFTGPVDPASLPATANDSLLATSSVFLVDVTEGSPTYGKRHPVDVRFFKADREYIGPNWLVMVPALGLPLRQKTTYAAILTDAVIGEAGGQFDAAPALRAALSSSGSAVYAPLRAWLATQAGLQNQIVNATVFTTQDATSIMFRLREATYKKAAAPVAAELTYDEAGSKDKEYNLYTGKYDAPNFQQGDPPYENSGGEIVDDVDGLPAVVRTETLRFALTVPKGDPPTADGWPVVLYAHGTGGSYKSFINDGSAGSAAKVTDGSGATIERFAMISIDQVLHGPRKGGTLPVELAFFNLFNVKAAFDNPKQGAADDFQLLRLVKGMNEVGPTTNQTLKFDPNRIYFKGHSQGGLTGPLFVAAEPEIKAAIFSGAGGNLIQSLLGKTEPVDIPAALLLFLLPPIDEFHPMLHLMQSAFEASDPANYGRLYFQEPPTGFAARPIFQSLGVVDHYTPIPTIKVLAKAMGVQPIKPTLEEIAGLDLAGLTWGDAPTQQNVGGGKATGVLLEYTMKEGSDGHFVIFDIPAAVSQSNRFLATHSKTGIATLTAP